MRYLNKSAFRRRSNYWVAAASELLGAPFRRWRPMPVPAAERARWRRGLLFGADHIGDVLYGTSSLPTLAAATPGCAWFHAVRKPADQVLENNPHLAGLFHLPPDDSPTRWRDTLKLIREGDFDVAICTDSSSYVQNLLRVALAGVPTRIGYVHKGFSCLTTHPIGIHIPRPFPVYFRDMVAQITGENPPSEPRPLIYPTDNDQQAADALFQARGLHRAGAVLACSIFTRNSTGVISPQHFIETLKLVQRKSDARLVFFASPGEREELERRLAESGLAYDNLAGELSLRAIYCFLRRCTAAFATDSGVRHIANAAGIPVVFARNLFANKIETGLYCSTETDISRPEVEMLPWEEKRLEVLSFDHAFAAAELCRILAAAPAGQSG